MALPLKSSRVATRRFGGRGSRGGSGFVGFKEENQRKISESHKFLLFLAVVVCLLLGSFGLAKALLYGPLGMLILTCFSRLMKTTRNRGQLHLFHMCFSVGGCWVRLASVDLRWLWLSRQYLLTSCPEEW